MHACANEKYLKYCLMIILLLYGKGVQSNMPVYPSASYQSTLLAHMHRKYACHRNPSALHCIHATVIFTVQMLLLYDSCMTVIAQHFAVKQFTLQFPHLPTPPLCTAHTHTLKSSTPVRCSTLQYSMVQYSMIQYSTVRYSTVQYSTVQYSTVQ